MDYLKQLQEIVGEENVRADEVERMAYSRDMSVHVGVPEAIVFANSTDQVSKTMALANEHKIPVIPRGSGTSVTGAVLAPTGGIVLDLSKMNKIKEINREDGYAVVEPGVILSQFNAALAPTHFYPPDPSSGVLASIGGTVATNASGERAVKYGGTKDWILGLEVVLADGRVLRTGTTVPKSSSGFDLTHVFLGSEGALGVVTEVTAKIQPMPEYVAFTTIRFENLEDAGATVTEILTQGIPLAKCEVLDRVSLGVVKEVMGLDIPDEVGCMLFIQVDGERVLVEKQMERIGEIADKHNQIGMQWTDDAQEMAKIWAARSGLVAALSKVVRGERLIPLVEDFGVPVSNIPAVIKGIQEVGDKHGFRIASFGHVGDGNIHAVLLLDARKPEHWQKGKEIAQDFIDLTLRLGGTLTAEHGTGMAKSCFMVQELGTGQEVMRSIKQALDPNGILNPGKMGLDDLVCDIYDYFAFTDLLERPEEVKSYGKPTDDEILACIQCGFCRLGCPIFAETALESRNARGHVILAYNLMTGLIEPSEELAASFYECTTCLNCKATCPAGVEVAEIVGAARQRLVEAGYLPDVFQPMVESLRAEGNPFGELAAKRTETYPSGFQARVAPADEANVLLYLGCTGSYQDLYIVPSMMDFMDQAGVKYTVLGEKENCCGYVAYLVGLEEEFKELMEKNLAVFEDLKPNLIVTTCAGCHRTLRDLYREYSGFDVEVLHAVEYMDRLIADGALKFTREFPSKVIYHDPCDIGRHMNIYEPPRNVLRAIPGLELMEFKLNRALAKCCGGGGGLKGFAGELSSALAEKRVAEAMDLGAEVITSACPTCKSNLKLAAAKLQRERKQRIKVMDITEVVAESL
ncbi:MAG TPA: FAD-binding protein [Chloroflexi bacterium]|nr:FAD-binding protein [Chloroflexota bacterium]